MRVNCRKAGIVFFLSIILFLFAFPLFGQTADKLEALLNKQVLNWVDAAVFVLEASEAEAVRIAGNSNPVLLSDPREAFRFAQEQKWLPSKAKPDDAVRLNGIALLLMRSFDLKGGIFYSMFKNPHYAYREMLQAEVIRGNTDPGMPVSGQELLLLIGRILTAKEQADLQGVQ